MENKFSLVLDKTTTHVLPLLNKLTTFLCILCDLLLFFLLAVCFLPFENMGWEQQGTVLKEAFGSLGYFILVAYGIKEMFVFLNHLREDNTHVKALAIVRFVVMIAIGIILGYVTFSLIY